MKHPANCNCPIHVEEDTTKVKHVALTVLVVFGLLFMLTLGIK